MSKRKLTADESVADVLQFVEDGDDVDDGDAADDLNEIYDDDINNDVRHDKSDDDNSFDSDDGDPEDYNQRSPRKILIYKRLVNFMDKSLDDNCYNPHDLAVVEDTQNEMVLTGFLGPKKNPKTENISWTKKTPQNASHQRACDISPRSPKPSTLLLLTSGIHTIADAFHALFPDEMVQLIISNTNAKIQHIKDNLPWYYNRSDENPFIRHLDERELYTYIGLHYARSILGQSMQSYKMLFSETSGHPVFSATMSKHRFYFLYTVLSFDDSEKRCGLSRSHRFAVAHELTFIFNDRIRVYWYPVSILQLMKHCMPCAIISTSGSTIPINLQSTGYYTSL